MSSFSWLYDWKKLTDLWPADLVTDAAVIRAGIGRHGIIFGTGSSKYDIHAAP
jgi:hypothetical protein